MNRTTTVFFLFIAVAFLSAAPPPVEWGPWMPLKDGGINGVQIAFKLFPNKTQYFKLKNTYPVEVKVDCQFNFTDDKGKPSTEHSCGATLAPGQEKKDPGWFEWAVTAVDYGSLTAKVRRADNNANMGQPSVTRAPAQMAGKAPTITNIELDAGSVRLLKAQSERLELAGAAKKLVAWSPLIGLVGESNAPHVLVSIYQTSWTELGDSFSGINKIVYYSLATESRNYANSDSVWGNAKAKQFWNAMADFYASQGDR
jgi:hypothetical protein